MQTKQEQARLLAKWDNHPKVKALRNALKDFAIRENLEFDAHGMNRCAEFKQAWLKKHGQLPNSGIKLM